MTTLPQWLDQHHLLLGFIGVVTAPYFVYSAYVRPLQQLTAAYPGDPSSTKEGIVITFILIHPLSSFESRFFARAKADHENLYLTFRNPRRSTAAIPWDDIAVRPSINPLHAFRTYLRIGGFSELRARLKTSEWDNLVAMRNRATAAFRKAQLPSPTEVFIAPRHREGPRNRQ